MRLGSPMRQPDARGHVPGRWGALTVPVGIFSSVTTRVSASTPPRPTLGRLTGRALLLRCPRCGGRGIWESWFKMKHACPTCGQVLERGESRDFWIGAYLINLVVAETAAVLIAAIVWLTLWPRVSFNFLWGASMVLAVVTPIVFYPFSRDLWLAWDLHFRPHEEGDVVPPVSRPS
jgi:uncharacterized protein (DUF983 family)